MTAIPSAELTSDDSKQLDEALTALEAGAVKWAALSLRERAQLLEKTHATTAGAARAWAEPFLLKAKLVHVAAGLIALLTIASIVNYVLFVVG